MSTKLHVTNLNPAASDSDVGRLFSPHGRVLSARVSTHPDAGPSAESAIVEMESDSAAAAAIRALDGSDFAGRALVVAPATRRNETDAAGTSQFGPMNMTADADEHPVPGGPGASGLADEDPGVMQPSPGFPRAGPAGEMRSFAFRGVPTRAEAGRLSAPGL